MQDIADLQESRRISVVCKNLAIHIYPRESCKVSIICEKLERYLFFQIILQDSLNLEEPCKVFINCKNLQCYLLIARILHVASFMEWNNLATYLLVSCERSNICKNVAECLLFAGILPDICFCRYLKKYHLFAKILQYNFFLEESGRKCTTCKNPAGFIIFSRSFLDIFYLEESGKISVIRKILAR